MTPAPAGRLVERLAAGTVDPELAALLWLLAERRIPVVVAGTPGSGRTPMRDALVDLLPPGTRTVVLRGDGEDFEWLPEAAVLGWRREHAAAAGVPEVSATASASPEPASPGDRVLVADLDDRPGGTWGERAHVAIRALAIGYGMAATARGDRLEDVLARLSAFPVDAIDDELTRLGVVLTMAATGAGPRVTAAHYLRPVVRDVHGHVQRMPPAVLATWDATADRFEHFAWGVMDELAGRTGRRAAGLEREQALRARTLATQVVPGTR